jgi:hypothetical protein
VAVPEKLSLLSARRLRRRQATLSQNLDGMFVISAPDTPFTFIHFRFGETLKR